MSDGRPALAHPDAIVTGDKYRFTVLSPRLIRMEWHDRGQFIDERTQLVVSRDFPLPEFTVTRHDDGGIEILTEYLQLRYDGHEFSEAGLSVQLLKGATDPHYSAWRYGFEYPQQPPFRGNLLGTARTLDEVDGATELDFGILATFGFAIADDSSSALLSEDGWIAARPESEATERKDLYLFAHGRDFHAALVDYHRLTGPNPVVPRYTLGNWWSRYWPYSEKEYLDLMDRFEDESIPLSVSVIDMDWHLVTIDPEIGTGWTGYTWNRELFPDPERFLRELHDRGLAVTLNVHPADGVRRHEEAYPQMAEAVGIDPASGLPVAFDITNREFVDAYLKYLHHPMEDQGVDFWWLDWQSGGATNVRGLDPLWMLNHIHFHDSGREGKRPLTFSRYAGLGSHRYPVGFSGDTITTWESLDFQPYFTNTAANVGYTWWSHDIGGHMMGYKDVEMTVRWCQYGVFSPINRLHSSYSAFTTKEPWAFGPRACDVIGRFMRLRHRLVPMLYTAAWQAHTDSVQVVRPMYHDHPSDGTAYLTPNQSMMGEHLLVAPITAAEDPDAKLGAVHAWLPEGGWFDLFTGQRYEGGSHLMMHRPMEQMPVLARAGAVLPLAEALEPITNAPAKLTFRVFPGSGVSHLIEDHGEGTPTAEDRNITRFVQELSVHDDGAATIRLVIEPTTGPNPLAVRDVVVEIVGATSVSGYDGAEVSCDETLSRALRIDLGSIDMTQGLDVAFEGLVPEGINIQTDVFPLLDAAEIDFVLKEKAWYAVKRLTGMALLQELEAVKLPSILRDAILERISARTAW